MEIKNDNMKELLPKLNSFEDHFVLPSRLTISHLAEDIDLLKSAEVSWKEIENFEFKKMDIDASFERMIKRI